MKYLEIIHWILLALACIGSIVFWMKSGFWLPRYIHIIAAFGLILCVWAFSTAPENAAIRRANPLIRLLLEFAIPLFVYVLFIVHGGQRVALVRKLPSNKQEKENK